MCAARNNLTPDDNEEEEEVIGLYKIDYSRPGLVLIFNNINFNHPDPEYQVKDRNGAKKDQRRVVELFEMLNFEVEPPFVNKKAKETIQILKALGERDYSEVDCLLVFIMSHGEMGTIYSTDCQSLLLEDFFAPFQKCKSLKNKPKLFFIQACRGNEYVEVDHANAARRELHASSVPIVADFLYAYATTDGTLAPRDAEKGTWYIQALCDVIERARSKDFKDILTRVSEIISEREAIAYDEKTKRDIKVRSISKFESCFRKKLFISQPKVI